MLLKFICMDFMSPDPLQRQIKERPAGNLKHMYLLRRLIVLMYYHTV